MLDELGYPYRVKVLIVGGTWTYHACFSQYLLAVDYARSFTGRGDSIAVIEDVEHETFIKGIVHNEELTEQQEPLPSWLDDITGDNDDGNS
jgi:hypothetical protein